jgi:tetratricopeptide (TPR) repeat protein
MDIRTSLRFLLLGVLLLTQSALFGRQTDETLLESGRKAMQAENYAEAIRLLTQATEANPANGEAWYQLGWCQIELEEYEKGLESIGKAKALLGDQARIHFELGYAYQRTQKNRESQFHYEKAIELKPDYSVAHRQLATLHFEVNRDFKKALDHYQKHMQYARPQDISTLSWFRRAYCEVEMGNMDEALQSLDESIAVDSNNTDAWNERGYIYFEKGQAEDAISAYEKTLSIDSVNSTAMKGIGDVYRLLHNDADKAFDFYTHAVRLNPGNALNHYGLAWCYNDKAEYAQAIISLQKAIDIYDKEAAYHAELGYAYYGLKYYDLALSALDQSLALKELPFAIYYKGLVYLAQKNKKKATEMYEKLKKLNSPDAERLKEKLGEK